MATNTREIHNFHMMKIVSGLTATVHAMVRLTVRPRVPRICVLQRGGNVENVVSRDMTGNPTPGFSSTRTVSDTTAIVTVMAHITAPPREQGKSPDVDVIKAPSLVSNVWWMDKFMNRTPTSVTTKDA